MKNVRLRDAGLFALLGVMFVGTGLVQSWNTALAILNMAMVSAIMALGVNMQWGYAGLFNVGIAGFVALGGLASVLVAMPPTPGAWAAGGMHILAGLALGAVTVGLAIVVWARGAGRWRAWAMLAVLVCGLAASRAVLVSGAAAVETIDPARTGYLGGVGLPVLFAWPVGAVLAAGAAWVIGKAALGLRADYLAIATLGIAEIVIAVLKNEEWLSRGVKNVSAIPSPVPHAIDLQDTVLFTEWVPVWGLDPVGLSAIVVKLCHAALILPVLVLVLWLGQRALQSPWGRMMRAIRDNEGAARAMGKDITRRHLQVFVLGSAVCGMAGAMMTTLDGLLTPGAYQPLRFTFLVWVMVIVGGSGSNWGAILGGMLVWWLWIQAEPLGALAMRGLTAPLPDAFWLKAHLLDSVAHTRPILMGAILLLVLRFNPLGLIPER